MDGEKLKEMVAGRENLSEGMHRKSQKQLRHRMFDEKNRRHSRSNEDGPGRTAEDEEGSVAVSDEKPCEELNKTVLVGEPEEEEEEETKIKD